MSMAEDEKVGGIELDEDEFEHSTLIPELIRIRLRLCNDGAKWILVAVKDASPRYGVGTPEFLKLRALARGANLVRFASTGLTLGYYGGAIAVIRTVYESLLYAYLFDRYPMQATLWVRLALDSSLEEPEAREEERRLWELAKSAFNEETGERDLGQTIWEETCKFIHHTLEGVAAECGLEPGQLIPEQLGLALDSSQGDFRLAIKFLELKTALERPAAASTLDTRTANLPWAGEWMGLFDEEQLDYWSVVLLYLTHRMADFTYLRFPPTEAGLMKGYKGWHQEAVEIKL